MTRVQPATPRTRAARIAWWLAVISIVVSTTALLTITLHMPYSATVRRVDDKRLHRVVVKSFLLTPQSSKLLYQSK